MEATHHRWQAATVTALLLSALNAAPASAVMWHDPSLPEAPIEKGKHMTRSPQEVFSDHLRALANRDVRTLSEDYSVDAVILTQQGALNGTTGAEEFYHQAFGILPDADFTVKWTVYGQDSLMAAWTATASAGHIDDGVDTLQITDGTIRLHASSFTIIPNETSRSPVAGERRHGPGSSVQRMVHERGASRPP